MLYLVLDGIITNSVRERDLSDFERRKNVGQVGLGTKVANITRGSIYLHVRACSFYLIPRVVQHTIPASAIVSDAAQLEILISIKATKVQCWLVKVGSGTLNFWNLF